MQPEIINFRELLVAGTVYEGKNEHQEIAAMWGSEFMPMYERIQPADRGATYGVCVMDSGLPDGAFRYIAGAEIARAEDAPADVYHITVPAGRYAVFKHIGALEDLQKTYQQIYQEWLPGSGYQRDDRPDLEVYTSEFHDFGPDSVLYLWVPLK